jgi:methionyl aminopeptidase
MIILKNDREIAAMRVAGRVAARVLDDVAKKVAPGLTTRDLDEYAASQIKAFGARSAFLGYRKYPCHICISVNEEVVHGLASGRRVAFGDIVSLDVGVVCDGFIGDTARTVAVGGSDMRVQKLMDVTERALYDGVAQAVPGNRVVDISRAIQACVEGQGFSVVREFVGHGVGRSVHEEPQIPNYVDGKVSPRLRPGMTLAIEPMVNAGVSAVKILSDGWTVVTQDGQPSAHFEHTILVTDAGPEILTCLDQTPSRLKDG